MGKLPEKCPECDRQFSSHIRPKSKMQKKATTLFLAGIAVTFPWAILVIALASLSPVIVVPTSLGGIMLLGSIGVVVVFGPGLIIGWLAMRMPRVLTMNCLGCGWKQVYFYDQGDVFPIQ